MAGGHALVKVPCAMRLETENYRVVFELLFVQVLGMMSCACSGRLGP